MISLMRLDQCLRNLTLVRVLPAVLLFAIQAAGPCALSAPVSPAPKPLLPKPGSPTDIRAEVAEDDWVASRIVRSRSWVVSAGFLLGLLREPKTESMTSFHAGFQKDRSNDSAETYSLMIGSAKIWGAHWDINHYPFEGSYGEAYWGYGIGSFWKIEDQLASLVDTDSYHLRARVGFENLLNLKRRLRSEFVLRASPLGFSGEILVGWTFDAP